MPHNDIWRNISNNLFLECNKYLLALSSNLLPQFVSSRYTSNTFATLFFFMTFKCCYSLNYLPVHICLSRKVLFSSLAFCCMVNVLVESVVEEM